MEKRDEAEKIMRTNVAWSIGAGIVPIPVLDILAVTVIQLDMLKQLCRVYEVNYSESSGKAWLSTLTGSTLARFGASMIKAIPGIGSLIGGISMPVLSGASTYAIAQVAIRHFESGGNLLDIDFTKIKDIYEEFFKKGKDYATSLQKRQKTSSNNVIKKLEQLVELKAKGLITEEEFEERKQTLLEQL